MCAEFHSLAAGRMAHSGALWRHGARRTACASRLRTRAWKAASLRGLSAAPQNGECRLSADASAASSIKIKVAVIASGDVYGAKSAKGRAEETAGEQSSPPSPTSMSATMWCTRRTASALSRAQSGWTSEGARAAISAGAVSGQRQAVYPVVDHRPHARNNHRRRQARL